MNGKIVNLFIKREHGEPMDQVDDLETITNKGIVGDASFGRAKRQILLVDQIVVQRFNVNTGDLRENLTVSGIQLSSMPSGSTIRVGETLLEIDGDCHPCDMLNDLHPGLRDEIKGHRGILARVIEEGTIRVGDSVAHLPLTESTSNS